MAKALESPVMQVSSANPLSIEFPGPALRLEASVASTPGTPQVLITVSPPEGKLWKLRRVEVVSRAYSEFTVQLAGVVIKDGKTSSAESTVSLPFDPWAPVLNPTLIELVYSQETGPSVPVTARIYYTEE